MSPNLFKALKELLPDPPLTVGTVESTDSEVHTITLPGGNTIQARGVASVGDVVFVRNGLVEGPAPTLPIELIEI